MKTAVLLTTIALAGCAGTIDQNRARTPSAVFTTRASEASLEHCLVGKLFFMGTPLVVHGEQSAEIAFNSDFGTELLVTISPAAGGSRIELRMKHRNYLGRMRRAVESCL